jgi:hypothetical protein
MNPLGKLTLSSEPYPHLQVSIDDLCMVKGDLIVQGEKFADKISYGKFKVKVRCSGVKFTLITSFPTAVVKKVNRSAGYERKKAEPFTVAFLFDKDEFTEFVAARNFALPDALLAVKPVSTTKRDEVGARRMRGPAIVDDVEYVKHIFPLRRGAVVAFNLPEDVTGEELRRLASFLLLLPCDGV